MSVRPGVDESQIVGGRPLGSRGAAAQVGHSRVASGIVALIVALSFAIAPSIEASSHKTWRW